MTTRQTLLPALFRVPLCLLSCSLAALTLLAGCSGGSGGGSPSRAPAPIVANISPTTVAAGSSAFTLAVTGSNFQSQAVVNWNSTALATTYNSATSLSAAVPANLVAAGVIGNITVANPDGQASSSGASSQVSVTNPVPTLTAVTPSSLYAGSNDTTFNLTGTNFNASSVVTAGTGPVATTFVSSTQLTAVVPAATLASVGLLVFSVNNPAPGGGASQTITVALRQPPAKLTSLSPASITAGPSPVTVTITGSYFTPTAVVYLSGFQPVPTTYVSSTSIQFTLSAQSVSSAANYSIIVRDPASQNLNSNSLTFSIVNPVPVLNSISPGSVTAGAPNFSLTLTGTNFIQSSTVLVNGVQASQYAYPSATSATVIVPASAVSSVADVSVTITNPTPGGGTSAAQTLHVISASNRIRTVNLQATDLGWDATHSLLVAASGSTITNTPNEIVTIDPLQGTILTTQTLPSAAAGISVTDDGSFVYVTLPSTGQVERFTLPSLTLDSTFALGTDSSGNLYTTATIKAAPGHPHTVAIARHVNGTIPMDAVGGVAVYDDGIARPNIAIPSGYYNYYDTIVWGSDATTLYGTNAGVSSADEDTFAVNASGVTLASDQPYVIGEFVRNLAYDTKTGHLIDGYGNVVNATTDQYLGQMLVQNTLSYEENPFALDIAQRRAFYLNDNGFYPNPPNGTYIQVFDTDRYSYINSMLVQGLTGGSSIIRWGATGLAINGTQIYIIDGSFLAPTGVSSAVGGFIATSPTLTSISPAAVPAGSPATQITLTGRDFTQSSQVSWNNQTLLINSVSDTQIVASIPASLLTSAVASGVTVTNGPGTGPSGSLGFSVLPNLGANAQITALDIAGQDLAWDNTHNLLYVAVPYSDAVFPNSIAVINPTTPAIQQTIPAADQPSALSLSDDAQYLYVGFWGQPIVERFSVPSFSLDLTIPVGAASGVIPGRQTCNYASDVKAQPGNPQTIAITYGNINVGPRNCGTVAIFDNATPRPTTATAGRDNFASLAWGNDVTTLFAQIGSIGSLSVSSSGADFTGYFNTGSSALGPRVHFDATTGLLFSDTAVITDPVAAKQVGSLSAGGLLVTDDALKRIFVLSSTTGMPSSGQGASTYILNIFDLNTHALLNSITLPGILGYPNQMVRWGANGLVFVTSPNNLTTSPGTLYLLQGSAISGTP